MKTLLTILCLLILVSCSPTPEITSDQLVERQGITYEVNSQTPFTGISVEYYLDTIINNEFEERVLKTRITFKDGIREGLKESFHPNSQLEVRGNYKNGLVEDGLYEYFDKDGNPTDTKEYINGETFDIKFEYSDLGQPEEKTYYKNGREVSKTEFSYYENGQLRSQRKVKDGTFHGSSENYHENGQLFSRGNYKEGIPDGLGVGYHENGEIRFKECYQKGEKVDMSYCEK